MYMFYNYLNIIHVLFTLVIPAVMYQSGLFEGGSCQHFTYNIEHLTNGKYRLAGQLVALSIRYDGPGPKCLNAAVYAAMCERPLTQTLSIEQLPDGDMKTLLTEASFVS